MRVLIALLWVALAFAQPAPPTNLRASTKPMATFVQGAVPTAAADPISCTFSSAPTEGNLLIAAMSERSGNSTTNHTISGSGWTKRVGRDVSLPSGDNRRTLTIWTKVAGASEPSTITMDDGGTGTSKNGFVAEYALESGEDTWEFLEAASNDNGETDNATSLATGTTSSLSGTQMVVFGVGSMKAASGAPSGHTWASATLTANVSSYPSGLGSYGMWLGIASANSDAAGTKASTLTMGGGPSNDGLTAAILVFNLVSGGPGEVAGEATLSQTYTMAAASVPVRVAASGLAHAEDFSAAGVGASLGAATLTQMATLSANAIPVRVAAVDAPHAEDFTASAIGVSHGSGTLSQSFAAAFAAVPVRIAGVDLPHSWDFTAEGSTSGQYSATLSQAFAMSAAAVPVRVAALALGTDNDFQAAAVGASAGTATLQNGITATFAAVPVRLASLALPHGFDFGASGIGVSRGEAVLNASASMALAATFVRVASSALGSTWAFSADYEPIVGFGNVLVGLSVSRVDVVQSLGFRMVSQSSAAKVVVYGI